MKKILYVFMCVFVAYGLTGCATGGVFAGNSVTRFQTDVAKIYDASLAVLEDENLPVVSKSLSKDSARIISQYPNGISLAINVRTVSIKYAQVNVKVGASGDDYRAYELMKKIESRVK